MRSVVLAANKAKLEAKRAIFCSGESLEKPVLAETK
jgi:hypothetical protein